MLRRIGHHHGRTMLGLRQFEDAKQMLDRAKADVWRKKLDTLNTGGAQPAAAVLCPANEQITDTAICAAPRPGSQGGAR